MTETPTDWDEAPVQETVTIEDAEENTQAEPEAPARKRTLLELWWEVLQNVPVEREKPIGMSDAVRLLGHHSFLTLRDLGLYHEFYFNFLQEGLDVLQAVIEDDPESLEAGEDDAELNRAHYLNVLINWTKIFKIAEEDWDSLAPSAPAMLAAYIDAAAFLIGQQGLIAHLAEIEFPFDETDQAFVAMAVNGEEE